MIELRDASKAKLWQAENAKIAVALSLADGQVYALEGEVSALLNYQVAGLKTKLDYFQKEVIHLGYEPSTSRRDSSEAKNRASMLKTEMQSIQIAFGEKEETMRKTEQTVLSLKSKITGFHEENNGFLR